MKTRIEDFSFLLLLLKYHNYLMKTTNYTLLTTGAHSDGHAYAKSRLNDCVRRRVQGHHQTRSAEQRRRLQDLLRGRQSVSANGHQRPRDLQEGSRPEADQRAR